MFRLDPYRHAGEVETEFMTLMWFADHEAIVRFAGPDWETAVRLGARCALSQGLERRRPPERSARSDHGNGDCYFANAGYGQA